MSTKAPIHSNSVGTDTAPISSSRLTRKHWGAVVGGIGALSLIALMGFVLMRDGNPTVRTTSQKAELIRVYSPTTKFVFWIGAAEVTQSEFAEFLSSTGGGRTDAARAIAYANPAERELPVVVKWNDAKAFVTWLTERDRRAGILSEDFYYDLPTDQEWSYAAGGGIEDSSKSPKARGESQPENVFPWGTGSLPAGVNVLRRGDTNPPPPTSTFDGTDGSVGRRPVKMGEVTSGLYDLAGNVAEWTASAYEGGNEFDSKVSRTIRGGFYGSVALSELRLGSRRAGAPDQDIDGVGFRIACRKNLPKELSPK